MGVPNRIVGETEMASSLRRISSHAGALRTTVAQWSRPFSVDALVEIKAGEIGMVSGIPEEHLRRRVRPFRSPLFEPNLVNCSVFFT